MSGEIGDVISGKLAVPKGKTKIFKSLGKLEITVEDYISGLHNPWSCSAR